MDKINTYTCDKCKREMITQAIDKGVTPMVLRCRYCEKGSAYSAFYRVDQSLKPDFVFYRPNRDELRGLTRAQQDHVRLGGLLLKEI